MKLTCEHITKVYGGREVLRDVSLTLEEGKIYGLIGRTGAGKTTLLSILTAQNPATRGAVALDGMPVWENRRALEKLCFSRELNVGAESGLAAMKVKEYLRIASVYYDSWDRDMEKRLVELFGLNVKKKLGKLSKGMLSMVTIIVAMCSKAPFTFLDEPVAGAVAVWPVASRPWGLAKWEWDSARRGAISFISATKASTSSATQWATARAASFPLESISP